MQSVGLKTTQQLKCDSSVARQVWLHQIVYASFSKCPASDSRNFRGTESGDSGCGDSDRPNLLWH